MRNVKPDPLEHARQLLEAGEPALTELAAAVGISASHLQRSFRARFGLSPAEYLAQRKLGALKSGLREGRAVSAALYDAGYGSPSRVYPTFKMTLAVLRPTPGSVCSASRVRGTTAP